MGLWGAAQARRFRPWRVPRHRSRSDVARQFVAAPLDAYAIGVRRRGDPVSRSRRCWRAGLPGAVGERTRAQRRRGAETTRFAARI